VGLPAGPHRQEGLPAGHAHDGQPPGVPPLGALLQQEHDVGRDTVLRALELLREEGLVFTVPRRGTYVSPEK
jgi:hypothetical protein